MKIIKKLVIAIIGAAMMLSSAGTVLADETPSTSAVPTVDVKNLSFDTIYGNQLPDFLNHEYVFNGQKIPLVESNYYFIMTFVQLCQYAAYGYYPATASGFIDLTAKTGEKDETYADFFVKQSELYLQRIYIYKTRAVEAGLTLGDEDKKVIDTEITQRTEQQAKPAGVSLDYILKLYFGPDCDEKAYRTILENAALASKYQQKYVDEYKVPEDQKNIPSITYALFYAPASATADEKTKAEASAKEMLGKCKSIEDLKTLGSEAKTAGVCRDAGTVPVQKHKMVPAFEAWAYGPSRKAGEMDVIYAEEYGYFAVGYNGMVELDEGEKKDMASNALNTEITKEIEAGKYGFKTDKPYAAAKPYENIANKKADAANTQKTLLIVFGCIAGVAVIVLIVVAVKTYGDTHKTGKKSSKSNSSKNSSKSSNKNSSNGMSGNSGKSGNSGSKKSGKGKKN